MSRAIAQIARVSAPSLEAARMAIVCASALALIAAGQALPF